MLIMTAEEESKLIGCLLKAAMKLNDSSDVGVCAGEYITSEEWKELNRWILWPRTAHHKMVYLRIALQEVLEELAEGSYTHRDNPEAWPSFAKEATTLLKIASDQINAWSHAVETGSDSEWVRVDYERTKDALDPDDAGEYVGDTT